MKSVLKFTLLLLSFTLALNLSAQKKTAGELFDVKLDKNGAPSFLKFSKSAEGFSNGQEQQLFKEHLGMESTDDLKQVSVIKDEFGFTHKKFQQFHNGVKVEYATYGTHAKNGKILVANGDFNKIEKPLSKKVNISKQAALGKATQFVGASLYMWQDVREEGFLKVESGDNGATYKPTAELVYVKNFNAVSKEDAGLQLAYKFDIYAKQPLSRDYVYVSAKNGKIIHVNPIIKHCNASHKHADDACGNDADVANVNIFAKAKSFVANATGSAATRYSGTQTITTDSYNGSYRLRDYSRGSGILTYDMNTSTNYNSAVDFVDANNSWTEWNNSAKDNGALDAHWGAAKTYDYFLQKLNRNSYDGNGAAIRSYVHYDSNYDNAFWDGQRMTYGDGNSFDILTSLDVAAHEIGHAVCSSTANLVYSYESGAMNEGFSDIWGACVEYYAAPNKQRWAIGEDIGPNGNPLRSMSNPNSQGQPDTYKGTSWYSGSGDNGGVHYNSGVLNFWFYVLTEGGSSTNDNGDAYTVAGIGIDKAAQIAYRLESVYLSSNSQYADARTYGIQAAEDLYGAASAEVQATTNAFYAVGIGAAYSGGGGGGGGSSYCASLGTDASYEWIASVNVGSFTNTSGTSSYTDYTSQNVNINAGAATAVAFTPGFSGSTYTEYWKVYIDYNNDNDFEDAGEEVYASAGSASAVSGSFTAPSSAAGVTTRMRISMKYNAAQTPCETFSYGEVEDYTVVIGGGAPATCATPTGLAASSITETTFALGWNAVTGAASYDVQIRVSGGTWQDINTATNAQNLTGATAGTAYEVRVRANCSNGASSAYSSIINVTTTDTSTPTPTCATPTGVTESGVTETAFAVSWTAGTSVTSYDVQVRVAGGTWSDFNTTTTSQSFTGATGSTTYEARVRANCSNAVTSAYSAAISFTTDAPAGGGGGGCTFTSIDFNDFESTWGIWNDGGSDCYAGSSTSAYANSGSSCVRLRDNTSSSVMTTDNLNLAAYSSIKVDFSYITNSMDNANEDFWLQVSTNGGATFTTVEEWNTGDEFNNGQRYNESVTIDGTFSSTTQLRFRCDASANGDQVYIDDVDVAVCAASFAPVSGPVVASANNTSFGAEDKEIGASLDQVRMSPNPARNVVQVAYSVEEPGQIIFQLMAIDGRLVIEEAINNQVEGNHTFEINTTQFAAGTYFLKVRTEEGVVENQKLVIIK